MTKRKIAMKIGQLDPENEKFINKYKELGYVTKTQLANDAFTALRRIKAEELRLQWLNEAYAELAGTKPDRPFEAIDGEGFKA